MDRFRKLFAKYRTAAVLVCGLLTGLVFMNLVFISDAFRETNEVNQLSAGLLGDFVGGYIGTFFTLCSALLLYLTLKNQKESTERNLTHQNESTERLSFETKYFELIRLHRENVTEIDVQGIKGRRFFLVLLKEYKAALQEARSTNGIVGLNLNAEQLSTAAYYAVFYGTGTNSSSMLRAALGNTTLDEKFCLKFIERIENQDNKTKVSNKLGYTPFEGHQCRLGHYYRHLYQSIKYIDQHSIENKYDYTKLIRAQLSNHEQALLLINSLTPLGRKWWDREYITKYKLVKNIPENFFHPYDIDVLKHFSLGYFEWQESSIMSK